MTSHRKGWWLWLIPWSRFFLEKLIVTQLIKKFLTFYGTRRFINVFTTACHWFLSWTRCIQSTTSYPLSLRSALILSSHVRLGLLSGLILIWNYTPLMTSTASGKSFVKYLFPHFLSCSIRGCIQKFPDWVITKYTHTTINTRWEATQRIMAAKLITLTHKLAIQLHLVSENCTICSSRSSRSVR
jgi:hypothetical protein